MSIGNTPDVIASDAAFDVDVGFIEGTQTRPDPVVRPWMNDGLVIVALPAHALAVRTVTPRLLRDGDWALRGSGSGTRESADRWLFEHLGSSETIKQLVVPAQRSGFRRAAPSLRRSRKVCW